ncbi:MAG: chemotaxis response regulator protein-glutamate methylesterase [Polyangiaceae bacterium]
MSKIRVLVVDDSALIRQLLSRGLAMDPEIEVVGTANDPYVARDLIVKLNPDVLTLDVEMPRMTGVEFLKRLMPQHPMPVVMVSSLTSRSAETTMEALSAGAVDFVLKPAANVHNGVELLLTELIAKVKAASRVSVSHLRRDATAVRQVVVTKAATPMAASTDKILAIGASTGGIEAVRDVLVGLPVDGPGVVVVQHMPPVFTRMYAERLDRECPLSVKEAKDGDRVIAGRVLLAPGGIQCRVVRSGGHYVVRCEGTEPVSRHCPSVDVMFESVAKHAGKHAVGVILTGMGSDGAAGMLSMHKTGAHTIAQDQDTCVVYGMPKVAVEMGGVTEVLPLPRIAQAAVAALTAGDRHVRKVSNG